MSQTMPLTDEQRVLRYLAHTNRAALTRRQERRADKKRNLADPHPMHAPGEAGTGCPGVHAADGDARPAAEAGRAGEAPDLDAIRARRQRILHSPWLAVARQEPGLIADIADMIDHDVSGLCDALDEARAKAVDGDGSGT